MRDPSLTPIAWGVNWVRNGHLWKLQLVIGDDYAFEEVVKHELVGSGTC